MAKGQGPDLDDELSHNPQGPTQGGSDNRSEPALPSQADMVRMYQQLQDSMATTQRLNAEMAAKIEELDQERAELATKVVAPPVDYEDIVRKIAKAHVEDKKLDEFPEEADDPDDFIRNKSGEPAPVMFFTYCVYYPITFDRRDGRFVYPPAKGTNGTRMIEFVIDSSKVIRSGKQEEVVQLAKYSCSSKRVAEWLRKHSEYNKVFFENIPARIDQGDVHYARRMSQIMAHLGRMDAAALSRECGNHSLLASTDREVMISHLSMAIIQKEFTKHGDGRWIEKGAVNISDRIVGSTDRTELLSAKEAKEANHANPHANILHAEIGS
jgi:hypothetical protein